MKNRKKTILALLFAAFLAVLSGCGKEELASESAEGYAVFYVNSAGNKLVESRYKARETEAEPLVQELLTALLHVPADLDCQTAMPPRVEKISYRQEENVLYLYMDANYVLMNSVQEILCRAALTKTLTQIEGIDYLSIYCAEQPIVDGAGNPVGLLSESDFVDSVRNVNSFEKVELTLYFANETGDKLVEETREVMRSSNTSLERLVVEQLIEGPQAAGGFPTLPESVKALSVSVNDSVCSVNFNGAFAANTLEIAESLPIYSIVNSLTELPTVSRVQIRVNGSEEIVFRDSIPLNAAFERDVDYIEGGKTD